MAEAFDRAMDAATRLNNIDDVTDEIRQLVESNESAPMQFVRQCCADGCSHLSSINEV